MTIRLFMVKPHPPKPALSLKTPPSISISASCSILHSPKAAASEKKAMLQVLALLAVAIIQGCCTEDNPYRESLYLQQLANKVNKDPNILWTAEFGATEAVNTKHQQQHEIFTLDNDTYFTRSKRQTRYGQSLDWRLSKKILSPQYQGNCGSCWAFSAMHALADRLAIMGHTPTGQHSMYSLSIQHVLECCNYRYCSGCNGAIDNAAGFAFVAQHFTVYENCRPYESTQWAYGGTYQYCQNNCPQAPVPLKGFERLSTDQEEIKTTLLQGPVIAMLRVYSDLYVYKGGIYRHTGGNFITLHSVEIVGYGSQYGQDYWIIKNSWGPYWGEGGYFRMVRGENHCGIEDNVIAPIFGTEPFVQGTDIPLSSSIGATTTAGKDDKDVLEAATFVAYEIRPFCQDGQMDSIDMERSRIGEYYSVDEVIEATRKGVQGINYNLLLKLSLPRCSRPSHVQADVFLTPEGRYTLLSADFISSALNLCGSGVVLIVGVLIGFSFV